MKKIFLISLPLLAIALSGCTPEVGDENFASQMLPTGAKNVRQLGNNWITFDLEIDGKSKSFLYYGRDLGTRAAVTTVTELNP